MECSCGLANVGAAQSLQQLKMCHRKIIPYTDHLHLDGRRELDCQRRSAIPYCDFPKNVAKLSPHNGDRLIRTLNEESGGLGGDTHTQPRRGP
jgi:hypothetical protein